MANVLDWLFNYKKLTTQAFGQNGEKGIDLGMNWGTYIGSPVDGKVVWESFQPIGGNSIGDVVQIVDNNGYVWHFQHMADVSRGTDQTGFNVIPLNVGDTVHKGDIIGVSGGCPDVGYGGDTSKCTKTDQYSTGPHIEVRVAKYDQSVSDHWSYNWQDPRPVFDATIAGNPGNPQSPGVISNPGSELGGNCVPWDLTCIGNSIWNGLGPLLAGIGIRVGLFALALLAIFFGFKMMANV